MTSATKVSTCVAVRVRPGGGALKSCVQPSSSADSNLLFSGGDGAQHQIAFNFDRVYGARN